MSQSHCLSVRMQIDSLDQQSRRGHHTNVDVHVIRANCNCSRNRNKCMPVCGLIMSSRAASDSLGTDHAKFASCHWSCTRARVAQRLLLLLLTLRMGRLVVLVVLDGRCSRRRRRCCRCRSCVRGAQLVARVMLVAVVMVVVVIV